MSRLGKWVGVVAFLAWLALPLLLWLMGVESTLSKREKRRLKRLPELAVERLLEPELYTGLAAAFGDRMPLRVTAVGVDAWLDLEVFGDSPNVKVLIGAEGWLFKRDAVAMTCQPPEAAVRTVGRIEELSRLLEASGRRLVFLVAPNKAAIYPEYLGSAAELAGCSRRWREHLRQALAQAELPGAIDLWQGIETMKSGSEVPVYWPHDTHWTSEVAVEATRRIVEHLSPSLWQSEAVSVQADRHDGDLADMIGLPRALQGYRHEITRDVVVKMVGRKKGLLRRLSTVGRGKPKFHPRVLSIYDSFGATYLGMLPQYLGKSTWIAWRQMPGFSLGRVAEEIARADVVVIEIVERALASRFGADGLATPIVDVLWSDLPRAELTVSRGAGGREVTLPVGESATFRYMGIELATAAAAAVVRADVANQVGAWRPIPVRTFTTSQGRQRVVVALPPTATAARIRPPRVAIDRVELVAF